MSYTKITKMKRIISIMTIAAAAAVPAMVSAQNTYSGYFLENYTYGYEMNPAFGNNSNYVSMPVLGNLNLSMRGTLHLSSVVFNRNGKTVLFTNPDVSVADAMKDIKDNNRLATYDKIEIMSAGFKAWGGYNTINISAVANVDASVPGSFFRLAKEGITNRTYDIKDLSARAEAYAQIALNHSRDIKRVPGLRVGASVKFLIGIGAIDAKFNDAQLELGENNWIARTNADVYASVKGMKFKMDTYDPKSPGFAPYEYVSGMDVDNFGLNGFGMGFDLGAEYKWRDFNFSLAVLDRHGKQPRQYRARRRRAGCIRERMRARHAGTCRHPAHACPTRAPAGSQGLLRARPVAWTDRARKRHAQTGRMHARGRLAAPRDRRLLEP